ncbi:MAG TPA: hypothetical protein VF334_15550 [Polyangia bacterium]
MKPRYLIGVAAIAALALGCKRHRSAGIVGDARASSRAEVRAAAQRQAEALSGDEESGPVGMVQKGSGGGMARWRDPGVYVDGRPVGVLRFGELPIGLKPTWVVEEHSVEFDYGYKGPRTSKSYARRYRVIDYLKALGVDVARIKEIQVPGPKESQVIIASGKDLRSKKGQDFMFRFGAVVGGKPIPCVPDHFGNGVMPDKMGGIMVYIDKKPPVLVQDEGLAIDGKLVDGVPYFGEAMRGGVRIYSDDRLSSAISAQSLDEVPTASVDPDGSQRWKLASVLKQNGVDLSKVVEAWLIVNERRKQKLTRAELDAVTFTLNPKQKNELLVGDGKQRAEVIALHSHALAPDELPQIRPDESVD